MPRSSKYKADALSGGSPGKRALKRIREQLMCSICLEIFTDPRVLPCYHSFCLGCLRDYVRGNRRLKCPNCQKQFSLVNGSADCLPSDFKANSLLEFAVMPEREVAPSVPQEEDVQRVKRAVDPEMFTDLQILLIEVLCSICNEIFSLPLRLRCGHTFCTRCLNSHKILAWNIVKCPQCNKNKIGKLRVDMEKLNVMRVILQHFLDAYGPDCFCGVSDQSAFEMIESGFTEEQDLLNIGQTLSILIDVAFMYAERQLTSASSPTTPGQGQDNVDVQNTSVYGSTDNDDLIDPSASSIHADNRWKRLCGCISL